MQDRYRQLGKIHLQRTAGPYIWVNRYQKELPADHAAINGFDFRR
jgi:hypothetical protein